MSRSISKKTALAGLAAAGIMAVGIAPAVAFAQEENGSSSTTTYDRDQRRAERDAEFAAALATELGISEDKVTDALATVREQLRPQGAPDKADQGGQDTRADRQAKLKERLDKAVSEGKLTQEQADAILKAYEAGVFPSGGGPGGGPGGPR